VGVHDAGITDLAACFAVKRRLIEDDGAAVADMQDINLLAVLDQCGDHALGGFGLVAEEVRRAPPLLESKPECFVRGLARARPGGARLFALALHGRVEALRVHGNPARLERILSEVEGKAIGIVKREGGFTGKLSAARKPLGALLEQRKSAREGFAKPR